MTTDARDARVRRLVSELVEAAPEPPPFPAAVAEEVATRHRRRRSLLVAALAAALVVGTVSALLVARRTPDEKPSPGGTGQSATVAYVDTRGLVVRTLSGPETVVASGTVTQPRWSPSGEWLAYRDEEGEVRLVRRDGTTRTSIGKPGVFAWSPRVDALAVTDRGGARIWSVDGEHPDSIVVEPPVGGVGSSGSSVAWSNDGSKLGIVMEHRDESGPGAPVDSLWVATDLCRSYAPVECTAPRDLSRIPYTPGRDDFPLELAGFAFDDTRLLFWTGYIGSGSIRMDGLPLRAVAVDHETATDLGTTIVRDHSWVQPSPDGTRVLVVRSTGRMVTDPREVDLCTAPDGCRPIAAAPDVQTLDPAWSPDGRRIAYVRAAHASFTPPVVDDSIDWTEKYRNRTLWIANADGTNAHEVTAAGRGIADPRFSPDGRSMVFIRDARVWKLDLASGDAVALSGSLRRVTACTLDDCLPDVAPYEGTDVWSDHFAVTFAGGDGGD
jgi:Tol biopolymer transport system component